MLRLLSRCPYFFALFSVLGCSLLEKASIRHAASLLHQVSSELEKEGSWERFKSSTPSQIHLVESLLALDESNRDFLEILLKAYAGEGFIVYETELLEENLLKKKGNSSDKAIFNYSRSLYYAFKIFELEGITYPQLLEEFKIKGNVNSLMEKVFSSKEPQRLETALFMSQAFAGLVNLQRDNLRLVAQLPLVKSMFDWVCQKNMDINFGACYLFYGAYEAKRPKMLGGNLEKGRKYFLQAIEKWPENYLLRAAYMEFFLIPQLDEENFKKQKYYLRIASENFRKKKIWAPRLLKGEFLPSDKMFERLNLYQALGLKRFDIMIKAGASLF